MPDLMLWTHTRDSACKRDNMLSIISQTKAEAGLCTGFIFSSFELIQMLALLEGLNFFLYDSFPLYLEADIFRFKAVC